MANENVQSGIDYLQTVVQGDGKTGETGIKDNIANKSLQGLRNDMIKLQGSTLEQITLTGAGATINTTELVVDINGDLYAYVGSNPTWVDNLGGAVDSDWVKCNNKELANKIENLEEVSIGTNSYRKWENGILEIFGRCECGGTGDFSKIQTFPINFNPTFNYYLQIDADGELSAITKRINNSTFAGSVDIVTSGHLASYYAIGRWK